MGSEAQIAFLTRGVREIFSHENHTQKQHLIIFQFSLKIRTVLLPDCEEQIGQSWFLVFRSFVCFGFFTSVKSGERDFFKQIIGHVKQALPRSNKLFNMCYQSGPKVLTLYIYIAT